MQSTSSNIEQLDLEPQKVYLTIREFEWGGECGEEVIGVSATPEIAEGVAASFENFERTTKREGQPWTRGRTVGMDWHEWDIRGIVPPPAVTRTEVKG